METTERQQIRMLLEQPRGPGLVASCYAGTAVVEGFEAHWLQRLKEEASHIRRRLADGHPDRVAFEHDLRAIREALESPGARRARGMAVFSASARDFFLALPSDVPFEDRLVLDEVPYVVPLIEAALRRRAYLVVLADSHRGRLYASGPGGSRLLDECDEEVPGKTRASGERWGKQQATIDRHRKDHILHFRKELAHRLEEAWDESAFQGIILLGEHPVIEGFRGLLPDRLARQVVHEAPHAWTDGAGGIDAAVLAVIDADRESREHRTLDDLSHRLEEGCAVAAGPQEVIDALRNGQVAELVLGPDPGAAASRCDGCGSLFAATRDACPYCASRCRGVNLWQEVLGLAMGHGVPVELARTSAVLDRHDGIAALLSRDAPQWAQPAEPATSGEAK